VSRFQFVDEFGHEFAVKRLCETLGVSRQGYYQWKDRAPARAAKAASDAAATARIKAAHRASKGVYGSPRVTIELRTAGEVINRKRVARLMRRAQIEGVRLRKRRSVPASAPAGQAVPDRIERDFTAPAPNRRYVGDITYLPLEGGLFLYLATVIDLHSRRLAGWAIADHMRTDLVETALRRAHDIRGSIAGAIFSRRSWHAVRLRAVRQSLQGPRGAPVPGRGRLVGRQRLGRVVQRQPQTRSPARTPDLRK
jgi:transposase InsO family protein